MDSVTKITLLVRGSHLYDKTLSLQSIKIIEKYYLQKGKIKISYNDQIVDKIIKNNSIKLLETKKLKIENPFIIFGTGITPNIESAKKSLKCNRWILINDFPNFFISQLLRNKYIIKIGIF